MPSDPSLAAQPHTGPDVAAAHDASDEPGSDSGRDSSPSSAPAGPVRTRWALHVGLFVATLLAVFVTGAQHELTPEEVDGASGTLGYLRLLFEALPRGWSFAVPLMAILLTHELGHYFAALYHRVPATLPYFIPLPILSPFGTMGAVISMPNRIRSRNALLDIGAAGPLAGLVVAIPVLLIGLAHSEVKAISGHGLQEGQCLLYALLKRIAVGEIPAGYDVFLSPTAFAGWAGLLVTSLNLLPIKQLDGGHIAHALFEKRQHAIGRVLHFALIGVYAYNLLVFREFEVGIVWIVWFVLLTFLPRHPPTEPGELTRGRRAVAVLCLVFFVALFMPTPLRVY